MRVLLLTSTFPRHKYFISELAHSHNVVGVVTEEKAFQPESYAHSSVERISIRSHFNRRDCQELEDFGHVELKCPIFHVGPNQINAPSVLEYITDLNPDVIAVYGTSIISDELILKFPGKILNIHLGLSPYYRGAGTNYWPLVNEEPEFCGVTIHYLDSGIDTGDIINRARARAIENDNIHTFGNRIIKVGVALMGQTINEFSSGKVSSDKQPVNKGKLYQRKDFSYASLIKLEDNEASGMFKRYASRQDSLLKEITIYDL